MRASHPSKDSIDKLITSQLKAKSPLAKGNVVIFEFERYVAKECCLQDLCFTAPSLCFSSKLAELYQLHLH